MKKIVRVVNETNCVGCGACSQSCHKHAISMQLNQEGFYTPTIDESLCVHCESCSKSCPVLNVTYQYSKTPDCYAMMANDEIRKVSSSGGAFTVIANLILKNGGLVCGVAYSDDYKLTKYTMIESETQLNKLRGSKYIMCDTGDIFLRVKQKLKEGKKILFCGLPCHVAALRSFLKDEFNSENLLTLDLICHGIPSVKAFENYMRDVHAKKRIKQLGFEDKRFGWHAGMTIEFDNDELFHMPCEKDSFFISYLNGLNKNRSCGKCKFAKIPRQGDITIGDFWGISKYNPELNDGSGTSVVLFNSQRGKRFIDEIKRHSKLFVPVPIEYAINGNQNLVRSPSVKISQSQFLRKLDTRHYPDLVKWGFDDNRFDIGIVGIPIFPNFGGTLTYYSLYRSLKDMGYTVALFSRPRSTGKPPIIPEEVYHNCPFDKQDLKLDFKDKKAMGQFANANCESFVVGSDQLFNSDLYKVFGEIVTLDWVDDNHRKIAYAASFGHNFFWGPESERAKMAYYMQKFDAFSVREEEATVLAKKEFGITAEWVLDPVFLCDSKHYIDVAENSLLKNSGKHIFAYILDPAPEKENIIYLMENRLGVDAEIYSEMLYMPTAKAIEEWQSKFHHKLLQGKVEDRLYSLIHSDLVIADSFHGICFAIIFNIPFIAILKLNLLNRMVTSVDEVQQNIELLISDFGLKEAQEVIEEERQRCLNWLRDSITPNDGVKKGFSTEDIVNQSLLNYSRLLNYNELKVNMALSERKYLLKRNIYDYLDELIKDKSQLIIFISVKDTPGYSLNDKIAAKLRRLGLKQNLINKHWHSYVAVISSGKVINETISKNEERVAYVGTLPCGKVKIVSRSFNSGNIAYIAINDVDYSENKRGLNIVVYDKVVGEVIDSVCFDTHEASIPYFRYKKRYTSVMPLPMKYEIVPAMVNKAVRIQPPDDLPTELLGMFYCCRVAAENSRDREVVLWEDNPTFRKILSDYFHIESNIVIMGKPFSSDSLSFIQLTEIKNKQDKYYVIIPNRKWDISDEIRLNQLGYREIQDYIFYNIRPIVLKNRDYNSEPYHDVYMNHVTGSAPLNTVIILRGYNNKICFGEYPSYNPDSTLSIDCSTNNEIIIGNRVRFVEQTQFVLLNRFPKKITIHDNVVFIGNQIRLIGDAGTTEVIIGERTTFNSNTCLHVFSGKRLIIGQDVMFSLNIRILCGDGHGIFDVISGKNINSIPDTFEDRQNQLIIGNHVWVGMNATILTGSVIGDGTIIGANSLVKGEYPNNCSIGGNPAKIIRRDIAWSRHGCSENSYDCGLEYFNLTKVKNNKKSVLVLGGTRFMGVKLVKKLVELNYDVTVCTRGIHKDLFGLSVTRIFCDRLNEKAVAAKLGEKYFDIVFDNVAYCSAGVDNILSYIKCGRYIQVSSVAVYPKIGCPKKSESDYLSSSEKYNISTMSSDYAKGKRESECIALQKYKDMNIAIARIPFVVECENMDNPDINSRLIWYVQALFNSTPIRIDADDYILSFIRTDEEADFLIKLAESDYRGVVNVSSEGYITVKELMDYLENKTGKKFVISERGILHPFNLKHFQFDSHGFWFDLEIAKSIGYTPALLSDWIYNLLDKYIEDVSKND